MVIRADGRASLLSAATDSLDGLRPSVSLRRGFLPASDLLCLDGLGLRIGRHDTLTSDLALQRGAAFRCIALVYMTRRWRINVHAAALRNEAESFLIKKGAKV